MRTTLLVALALVGCLATTGAMDTGRMGLFSSKQMKNPAEACWLCENLVVTLEAQGAQIIKSREEVDKQKCKSILKERCDTIENDDLKKDCEKLSKLVCDFPELSKVVRKAGLDPHGTPDYNKGDRARLGSKKVCRPIHEYARSMCGDIKVAYEDKKVDQAVCSKQTHTIESISCKNPFELMGKANNAFSFMLGILEAKPAYSYWLDSRRKAKILFKEDFQAVMDSYYASDVCSVANSLTVLGGDQSSVTPDSVRTTLNTLYDHFVHNMLPCTDKAVATIGSVFTKIQELMHKPDARAILKSNPNEHDPYRRDYINDEVRSMLLAWINGDFDVNAECTNESADTSELHYKHLATMTRFVNTGACLNGVFDPILKASSDPTAQDIARIARFHGKEGADFVSTVMRAIRAGVEYPLKEFGKKDSNRSDLDFLNSAVVGFFTNGFGCISTLNADATSAMGAEQMTGKMAKAMEQVDTLFPARDDSGAGSGDDSGAGDNGAGSGDDSQ